MAVSALPLYPSTQAWKDLSPSQRARLEECIASALQVTLDLPLDKQDVSATCAFVASYAKNTAQASLDAVIWQTGNDVVLPTNQRLIRRRTFELARRLSTLPSVGLTPETLVDLTIAFSPRNTSRLRALWEAVLDAQPQLLDSVADDVISSFIALLQPATIAQTGLYGVRKAAHCVSCVIHCAPSRLLARFVQNQSFVLVLARAYDEGLSSISQSYGGIQRFEGSATQQDDWEPVWMATKTALLDTFHTLLTHVLAIVAAAAPGAPLASASDHAFALVFALLDLPSAGARGNTPFYDQPLIADYQHAYDVAKTLGSALRRADAGRTDALDAVLRSLDVGEGPGALKLLLRSSSVASGSASARVAAGSSQHAQVVAAGPSGSGSSQPIAADPMLEAQVEQVRELFPDHSAAYVRALLIHPDYPFHGSAEKVIGALLEGHAPPPEEIEPVVPATAGVRPVEPDAAWAYTAERRNVFDDEVVDVSKLHVGKKRWVCAVISPTCLTQSWVACRRKGHRRTARRPSG
jgi:activating signal cointegrator complex subunit 2